MNLYTAIPLMILFFCMGFSAGCYIMLVMFRRFKKDNIELLSKEVITTLNKNPLEKLSVLNATLEDLNNVLKENRKQQCSILKASNEATHKFSFYLNHIKSLEEDIIRLKNINIRLHKTMQNQ